MTARSGNLVTGSVGAFAVENSCSGQEGQCLELHCQET